jgi:AcrR family transcriptional regulator
MPRQSKQALTTFEKSPHVVAPQQRRSREALAKIIAAADKILRAEGLAGLSMIAVSEAAGVPIGNIYRRFRSKEDILLALKEEVTNRVEDAVLAGVTAAPFKDVAALVHQFAKSAAGAFSTDAALHRVLLATTTTTPRLWKIGSSARGRVFSTYQTTLVPLLAPIEKARAALAAEVSFEIVMNAMVGKARGEDVLLASMSWRNAEHEFAAAAIAYLAGLRTRRT